MDQSNSRSVLKTRTGDNISTNGIKSIKRPRISVLSDKEYKNCNDEGRKTCGIENDKDFHDESDKEEDSTKTSTIRKTALDDERPLRIKSAPLVENDLKNNYTGWTVPSPNYQIPTITLGPDKNGDDDMTAQRFYKEYISQRRPVVIRNCNGNASHGILQEFEKLHEKWKTNKYLKERAEKELVMVEVRPNEKETFGKGHETQMSFGSFCDLQERGDTMHYLTTQDVEANNEGRPELMAPFMKALRHGVDDLGDGYEVENSGDFPLCPKLMGNLVPQNINMWMGNTSQHGTSSGLHHDYHDNFYHMIRGRKRFRLYSPKDTEKMYTRGKLHMVHPNGRINYVGDVTTAYGSDIGAHAAAKASEAKDHAEKKLAEAEEGVLVGRPGAQEELERAEEMLDKAMEALIDAEMIGEVECSSVDEDEDDDEDDLNSGEFSRIEKDDSSESDLNRFHSIKNPGNLILSEEEDKGGSCIDTKGNSHRLVDKTVKNPDNFSKVEVHLLDNKLELSKKFPDILNATPAFCDVCAGDILYLPASWFHEVTSFGHKDEEGNVDKANDSVHNKGHLALNYWFHPPDAPDNFEHPYSTSFWPNDYRKRFAKQTSPS